MPNNKGYKFVRLASLLRKQNNKLLNFIDKRKKKGKLLMLFYWTDEDMTYQNDSVGIITLKTHNKILWKQRFYKENKH